MSLNQNNISEIKKIRDREWLLLSVCENFTQHGQCDKKETCNDAHCDPEKTAMDVRRKKAIVCFEHLKGVCDRSNCHYYHATEEQKPQIIQRGRERQRHRREMAMEMQSLCGFSSAPWMTATTAAAAVLPAVSGTNHQHAAVQFQQMQQQELSSADPAAAIDGSLAGAAAFGNMLPMTQPQAAWGFYAGAPAALQTPQFYPGNMAAAASNSASANSLQAATNYLLATQGFALAPNLAATQMCWPQAAYLPLTLPLTNFQLGALSQQQQMTGTQQHRTLNASPRLYALRPPHSSSYLPVPTPSAFFTTGGFSCAQDVVPGQHQSGAMVVNKVESPLLAGCTAENQYLLTNPDQAVQQSKRMLADHAASVAAVQQQAQPLFGSPVTQQSTTSDLLAQMACLCAQNLV